MPKHQKVVERILGCMEDVEVWNMLYLSTYYFLVGFLLPCTFQQRRLWQLQSASSCPRRVLLKLIVKVLRIRNKAERTERTNVCVCQF